MKTVKEKVKNDRILTVPNLLSLLRVVLAIVFVLLFDSSAGFRANWPAFLVLGISGLTDAMDGKLARLLDQVSELGKILDPIADYITKLALILCFVKKYPGILGLLIIFLVRVFTVAWAGYKTVEELGENGGAIMAGKADTVVFYAVMLLLVLLPGMPTALAYVLTFTSGAVMIAAMVIYLRHYRRLRAEGAAKKKEEQA